jgi:hypothetical protein
MRRLNYFSLAFVPAFSFSLLLAGCRRTDAGPKVIQADGHTYIACGGVLNVHSSQEGPYDENPGTSEIWYEDPQGVRHHLTKVRSLTVERFQGRSRDLPSRRAVVPGRRIGRPFLAIFRVPESVYFYGNPPLAFVHSPP